MATFGFYDNLDVIVTMLFSITLVIGMLSIGFVGNESVMYGLIGTSAAFGVLAVASYGLLYYHNRQVYLQSPERLNIMTNALTKLDSAQTGLFEIVQQIMKRRREEKEIAVNDGDFSVISEYEDAINAINEPRVLPNIVGTRNSHQYTKLQTHQ